MNVNTLKKEDAIKTVCVTTLGCRANQYDSSAIEEILSDAGYSVISGRKNADAFIVNTCTVTGPTDSESRQLIRKLRRENPASVLIVTGCYAEVSPDEAASLGGVDYVIGNPEKTKILECLEKGRSAETVKVLKVSSGDIMGLRARSPKSRTRANLKLQDGCDKDCTYCIIPKARGVSRSVPIADAVKEIRGFVESGFKELVLTGIHLGAYGTDLKEKSSIARLVESIDEENFSCRFRISSLDPDEVGEELILALEKSKTFCNHMHLPLQSGSDKILKLMRRTYMSEDFRRVVVELNKRVCDIAIGADVIVGFPGEGDAEFEETFTLLDELPVNYLHVFPYSKREGTPAALFKGQVNAKIIKERCARLHELDKKKRDEFYAKFPGRTMEVLVESERDRKTRLLKGRTANYIPVLFEGSDELKRNMASVRFKRTENNFVLGEL